MGREVTAVLLGVRVKGRELARIGKLLYDEDGTGLLDCGVPGAGRVDVVGEREWTIGIALGVSASDDEPLLPPSVCLGSYASEFSPRRWRLARKRWAALERAVCRRARGMILPPPQLFLVTVERA